ncbi:SCO family protein [Noviherbaspirillum sp. 1P10PC]|uniref:SCO family protein n=1 Tax=Noviherbaspirillum sp. 1P10PC TaxID=3132292 RepID=UPI0039A2B6C1
MNSRRTMLAAAGVGAMSLTGLAGAVRTTGAGNRAGPRAGYFPNALLQTHDGRTVRFYDDLIAGKVVVINMMYTYCSVNCPPAMASLLKVQEALGGRLGRDVHMYSMSLQPEIDTPEALRAYAAKLGARPGWRFLTGRRGDMDDIRRSLGFSDPDPAEDIRPMRHTAMVRIGDETLDRWLMVPVMSSTRQIVSKVTNFLS